MRVIDPGHVYELQGIDEEEALIRMLPVTISFVKRVGPGFPGNSGPTLSGPTTQEVIRVLIDRMKYVNGQRQDPSNIEAICNLRAALVCLEIRAAHERDDIIAELGICLMETPETEPTCPRCGHLMCARTHERYQP